MRRHEAHGVQALAGKRSRALLHRVEPAGELVGHERRVHAELVGKLADVADGGEHVGRHGTALHALALEPREPTRLAHGHKADVGDGQLAHALPGPPHHAARGHEPLGGGDVAKVGGVGTDSRVDAALGRGVQHVLRLGGEQQQVVCAELEHAALKHGVEARLGVLRRREGMEQRLDDAHFGRRGEGGAAHDHALEAALAQGRDVGVGLVEAAHEHGHAARGHAGLADGGQAVCQLGGGHADAQVLRHGLDPELVGTRQLDDHARASVLGKVALAIGLGAQVHEARHDARVAAGTSHEAQDGVVASEVVVEPHGVALPHRLAVLLEHAHVGAAEAVDGLLGVAHRGEVAGALAGEALDHADLLGVGVLELVDHHQAELVRVLGGDLGVLAEGAGQPLQQVVVVEHRAFVLGRRVELLHVAGKAHERLFQALGACHGAARLREREGRLGLVGELLHGLGAPLVAVGPLEGIEHLGRSLGGALGRRQLEESVDDRQLAAHALELVLVLGVAGAQGLVGKLDRGHGAGHVLLGRHELERVEAAKGARRLVGDLGDEPEHALPGAAVAGAVLGEQGVEARVALEVREGAFARPGAQQVGVLVADHLEVGVEAQVERMGPKDAAAHVVDGAHPGGVDLERLLRQARVAKGATDALLDLAGRLLGEGDDERLVEAVEEGLAALARAWAQGPDDAARQGEGLSGARAGRHEDRTVERGHDAALLGQ